MKRKILACVVACATLFLGMGYAFWTDSLQINTTADSGKLEVKFVDLDAYGTYGDETGKWAVFTGIPGNESVNAQAVFADNSYNKLATPEEIAAFYDSINEYTKTTFNAYQENPVKLQNLAEISLPVDNAYGAGTNTSDVIKVSIDDIYPGYAQLFRTDILNTGTLAAKLSDIKLDLGQFEPDVQNMIGVCLDVVYEDGTLVKGITSNDTFTIDGVEFVRLSALEAANIANGENGDILYIYPDNDNTMDAIFGVAMDPDYAGVYTTGHVDTNNHSIYAPSKSDAASQLKAANFTIDFLWDQFNVADPYVDSTPAVTPR
jgi:hypothetical protein